MILTAASQSVTTCTVVNSCEYALWLLQAAAHATQGALYDPYDPATPYRQGAQDERALHAALHRSLAERQREGSDIEEHLRSAIAASLEVGSAAAVYLP